jgi:L-alanine-DL-glutamate epimerase-like enolase superfamily enzyme
MTCERITEIHWHHYRIPFLKSFATTHDVMTAREGIIVQITTARGICGIGEIAPLPPLGTESLAQASALLPTLAAHLHDMTLDAALDTLSRRDTLARARHGGRAQAHPYETLEDTGTERFPSTLCGLEIALLDALGKTVGHPVCALLSAERMPRTGVPVNAVIGAASMEATIVAA